MIRFVSVLYAFALLWFSLPVYAHDTGVTEVTLTELPDQAYQLVVKNQGAAGDLAVLPDLPDHCTYAEEDQARSQHNLFFLIANLRWIQKTRFTFSGNRKQYL